MLPAAQFGLIVENIGAGEIVVIAFLALVILGPDRIPEMARGAGRLLHNAKKFTSNLSGDMADVINDPAMAPIKELGEFAARPRQKITEYALEAEAEERQKTAAAQTAERAAAEEAARGESDQDASRDQEHTGMPRRGEESHETAALPPTNNAPGDGPEPADATDEPEPSRDPAEKQ